MVRMENGKGFTLIKASRNRDERGCLSVVEASTGCLPFVAKRIFWITDIPQGAERGGHMHLSCTEAVFAVAGSFDIDIDDGRQRVTLHLASPDEGVVIAPKTWCRLYNFGAGTVCVACCDELYDPSGYVNDYEEFKSWC